MPSFREVIFSLVSIVPFIFIYPDFVLSSPVDDMGSRIDELEKSIGELMMQAGIEESAPAITDGT
jgi:hypothetical protein